MLALVVNVVPMLFAALVVATLCSFAQISQSLNGCEIQVNTTSPSLVEFPANITCTLNITTESVVGVHAISVHSPHSPLRLQDLAQSRPGKFLHHSTVICAASAGRINAVVTNAHNVTASALVAIYTFETFVPGACPDRANAPNASFDINIFGPAVELNTVNHMIVANFSSTSAGLVLVKSANSTALSCQTLNVTTSLTYYVYYRYLDPWDLQPDSILATIAEMTNNVSAIQTLSVESDAGFLIHADDLTQLSSAFSSYPGWPLVVSVVVQITDSDGQTVEIPYALTSTISECSDHGSCLLWHKTISKFVWASLLLASVYVGLASQQEDKVSLISEYFITFAFSAALISVSVFHVQGQFEMAPYQILFLAFGGSIAFTLVHLIFRHWIRVLSFIRILSTAIMVAAVIMHILPGLANNANLVRVSLVYFSTLGAITVCTFLPFALPAATHLGLAVISSGLLMMPLSFYMGSHLQFAVWNVVRRLADATFSISNPFIPFLFADWILASTLLIYSLIVLIYRLLRHRHQNQSARRPNVDGATTTAVLNRLNSSALLSWLVEYDADVRPAGTMAADLEREAIDSIRHAVHLMSLLESRRDAEAQPLLANASPARHGGSRSSFGGRSQHSSPVSRCSSHNSLPEDLFCP